MTGARRPPLAPPRKKKQPGGPVPKRLPQVGALDDKRGMTRLVFAFLEHLSVRNYRPLTVESRRSHLKMFLRWCEARSIICPAEVTLPMLERYQRSLFYLRKPNGLPYTPRAQHNLLVAVKTFFSWLVRHRHLLSNPAADLEFPRLPKRLPLDYLSTREVELIMTQPDVNTPLGLRDRAILEVLYSTGVRRAELCALDVCDIDFERGVVQVRAGKGDKDRVVPIGRRALAWFNKYLTDIRPQYVFGTDPKAAFLGHTGGRIDFEYLGGRVKTYITQAGVQKRGSCHLFRHTLATLMLENGADIRYIQAILGHASLESTQVYTQVSIIKLKEVHAATHPAQIADAAHSEHASDSL